MKALTVTHYLFIFCVLSIAFFLGMLFFVVQNKVIDFSPLERYNSARPSVVLDDQGNEWARFALDHRKPITFTDAPEHVVQAFMAAEDWHFFSHNGLSLKGIFRSVLVNLYHGRRVQGASTITQQLVKLLFLEQKKTFKRKLKEQLYALLVEQQFTKEQIMQTYFNHIYLGCGIYGIEAASQRFWGKSTKDLSIDEAATLAGIVRSPGNYCPILYPLSAAKRRDIVLRKMLHLNFITPKMYKLAVAQPITIQKQQRSRLAPYVKEYVRQFVEGLVGKNELYRNGYVIQATLNAAIQREAEYAFKEHCALLKKTIVPEINGALISMDVQSGGIKALVGGYDFVQSNFNRALQARRQIGSVFKPLIYAVAVEQGATFCDTCVDEPLEIMQSKTIWSPNNFDMRFRGEMSLAYALSRSNNIVAIKTFLNVGNKPIVELAKKCRLQGPFLPYPSLALGCVESTLYEAVGMFNVFANNGTYVKPHLISWVKDRWGNKIWKHVHESERVIASRVSGQVAKALTIGINRVQKRFPHKKITAEVISKTGTTNDSRTCWFAGSTPSITTAIYIGCDNNRSMGNNVYPIKTALPIWLQLNSSLEHKQKKFVFDPSLKEVFVQEKSGKRALAKKGPGVVSILL